MKCDIKEIYVCSGIYHLFQSIYLARISANEKILVYLDNLEGNVPVDIFSEYFDRIIYIKIHKKYIVPVRLVRRCILAGWLFPFSRAGRECYDKSKKYRVFVFNDYQLEANRIIQAAAKSKDSIILVEEGLMTYSTNHFWLSRKRRPLVDLLTGIKIRNLVTHNPAIDTIMCKHPEKLPEVKSAGRRIIKISNMYLDKEWVSLILEKINLNDFDFPSNSIIWLGQPLTEVGLDEKDELEYIASFVDLLDDGQPFVIKPHPRDSAGKYKSLTRKKNVRIMDMKDRFWVPAELLFIKLKPLMVFTAFSSAADFLVEINDDVSVLYCAGVMGISLDDDSRAALKGRNRFYIKSMSEMKENLRNAGLLRKDGSGVV